MAKAILRFANTPNKEIVYWCEGCGGIHSVPADRWNFNGNCDKPTLSPSVRHFYTKPKTNEQVTTCHYHVQDGVMKYCGDCAHKLSGQNCELKSIKAAVDPSDGRTYYELES